MTFREVSYPVTLTKDVCLITIHNLRAESKLLYRIFFALAEAGLNLDMISETPPYCDRLDLSFSVQDDDCLRAMMILGKFQKEDAGLRTLVNCGNAKLSVSGAEMEHEPGVAAELFRILAENQIPVKLITTSPVNISLLIPQTDGERARTLLS